MHLFNHIHALDNINAIGPAPLLPARCKLHHFAAGYASDYDALFLLVRVPLRSAPLL
jgi:hypothetical protein